MPATAEKTSAPDVTSQSPRSESFGGICFLPNCHGNQTFPSQARRPLHRGFNSEAAINTELWGRSAERINDVRADYWRGTASLSGLIKRGDEIPGLWRERERDDHSALIRETYAIQQNYTDSSEIT